MAAVIANAIVKFGVDISSNKWFLDIRNHRFSVIGAISLAIITIVGSFTIIVIYGQIFVQQLVHFLLFRSFLCLIKLSVISSISKIKFIKQKLKTKQQSKCFIYL